MKKLEFQITMLIVDEKSQRPYNIKWKLVKVMLLFIGCLELEATGGQFK